MLGLGAERLRADMNRLLAFLFHQGILDEQFLQLQQLQDESSPNFVSEVVNIYFHESEKLLRNLRSILMDREFSDYKKMGIHLNQFMGSSSSIGAKRVRNVCVAFRAASEQNNRAGCLRALELLEHEYCFLKNKLLELFQRKRELDPASDQWQQPWQLDMPGRWEITVSFSMETAELVMSLPLPIGCLGFVREVNLVSLVKLRLEEGQNPNWGFFEEGSWKTDSDEEEETERVAAGGGIAKNFWC
ncbi:hypothetical protein COLO4_11951 [Corchorus olitorius]|uniref:Histidine-containing phosphotransfer protein n=1 Tax=Corchorus olitorius TaxID=93759 RepID=A0A1R3K2Q2_9ROSI|nr:hypothetical protein COLO4_11951 [Corchorus olitorius]